jgi:hypothetical protein
MGGNLREIRAIVAVVLPRCVRPFAVCFAAAPPLSMSKGGKNEARVRNPLGALLLPRFLLITSARFQGHAALITPLPQINKHIK